MNTKELLDSLWCNCGLDNPEPKYHSVDCTYRVGWEDYKGCVHMLKTEGESAMTKSCYGQTATNNLNYEGETK